MEISKFAIFGQWKEETNQNRMENRSIAGDLALLIERTGR